MIPALIRLAIKRGYAAGSDDGHWCAGFGGECDLSCSDLPEGLLDGLVDDFMAKYAPMFRDDFRDSR